MTAAEATATKPAYRAIHVGDPAPWFTQNCTSNPQFHFETVAGRYLVLCFYGTGADEAGRETLKAFQETHRALFDDDKIAIFGVSSDPSDQSEARARQIVPGIRHFWDFDGKAGRLYGALPSNVEPGQTQIPVRRFWMVLNPTLRVRAIFPFKEDGSDREEVMAYLRDLPPVDRFAGFEIPAPIIIVPDVFEPSFCRHLISLYEQNGGEESGFMREIDGKTVAAHDRSHKSRKDFTVTDSELIAQLQRRIIRRINPEIERVHFFTPTRMERYIVSCYAAEDGGHFRPHRDNTTKGTAHRRFAVSINLNDEFEGGEVSFPEYGSRSYKAPLGGAVVFSTPLLHAVSKVTSGRRYAFLPFLYDEAAAKVREANNAHLGEGVGAYKA
ncbi:2OG-Fe(II) oxygenase [Microvirga guangxiensis]|uniref:Peroxiredoxin n=1 Tax=Microvirga guangxiensis TaxID=549386 RepID=A0A1G5EA16_9HYPH|nr:2OG-Fe(II) oxygenase [Microvirga guangxiensis]SCY23816.1 Peroxiredoxin [Microvirga guangxiensis]